jgi:LPS-assembly lipoprotein
MSMRVYLLGVLFGGMALQSCGLHLRGEQTLPAVLQETHIKGQAEFSDLYIEIRRNLERSGAHIIAAADTATAILVIYGELLDRHVLSVDAQGRATEYELNYSVSFVLQDKSGKVLLPAQTVYQIRDYRFDPDNVLAKDTEEGILRKALVTAAVQQILRRIETGLRNPLPAPTPGKAHENPG